MVEYQSQSNRELGTEINEEKGDKEDEPRAVIQFKEIFNRTSTWRRNIFTVPSGRIGKEYLNEMTKRIETWSNRDENFSYSLYGLMILPKLILQKIQQKCKSEGH